MNIRHEKHLNSSLPLVTLKYCFNYCLLFAKYYLYYQQIYSQGCNASEFVIKLEEKLNMRISSKESYSHEDTSDF